MGEERAYPTVGGEDAGYLFEFKPDGVFLTVYETGSVDLMFELSDMRQILQDYGVLDYDIELLARAVRETSGKPVRLAEPVDVPEGFVRPGLSDEEKDENYAALVIDVSKDRMKATVRYDTKNGTRLPTVEMVMQALSLRNVSFGINDRAIEEGVKSLTPFVAAEGIPPVNGDNAYIDRKFDLGVKGRPVVNEYDRADYKNLNLFVLVKKNDTLAIRIPHTKSKSGTNIYGDTVPGKDGRPIPMPEGKNTMVVGEHQLVATINGQIVDTGSKISVDPRLEIKGTVGAGTGNIDFDGCVEIGGDVQAGFIVKATGDIEIKGAVYGAEITGRNVFIGGGITGMRRGKVFAEQDVRAVFIENATIEAGRDIYLADVALHSTMKAGNKIMVEEKKGQITGGLTAAGDEIRAKIIGNEAFVVTRVSVGVDPNLQRKYQETCKSYKEGKKRLQQITQTLNTLGKIDISRLPQERIDQINALTRSQFPLAGKLKKEEREIKQMEDRLAEMKHGKLRVSDVIYPGTRIAINSLLKNVQEEYKHCTFTTKDDEISLGPY